MLSQEVSVSEPDNSMNICFLFHADKLYWDKMKLKKSFLWKLK